MAIIGAHALLYTTEPEKVRAIFKDVFKFSYGYGITTQLVLPGALEVQLYEPRHEMAITLDRKR
mgnify:CR=1 FL=1